MADSVENLDVGLLLPFYINGELSATDIRRVEDALATDERLQADLKFFRTLAKAAREKPAIEDKSLDAMWDLFKARITSDTDGPS